MTVVVWLQGQALREWLGGHLSHRQENEGHRRQMLRGQGTDTLDWSRHSNRLCAERVSFARADHGEWVESIAAALEAASISTVPQLMEYQRTDEALAGCATPMKGMLSLVWLMLVCARRVAMAGADADQQRLWLREVLTH